MEVLIAIFVMAVGMLALLTLFPLGALSMAQSLQHDRAAAAANLAAEYAQAMDLRHDPGVTPAFTAPPPGYTGPPANPSGPSWPVFVDGFGGLVNPKPLGAARPSTPGISRVRPSYAPTLQQTARWFSLPDDLSFAPDATPADGRVQREGRYTWAYLLCRPRASDPAVVDLTVVVYSGRSTQVSSGETTYAAAGVKGDSGLVLTYTPAQGKPALRRNAWVVDVTFDATQRVTQGNFYRIVNVAEVDGQTLSLESERPLEADVNAVVVLDSAVEVLKIGAGRSP
jgi:hypothetical protein